MNGSPMRATSALREDNSALARSPSSSSARASAYSGSIRPGWRLQHPLRHAAVPALEGASGRAARAAWRTRLRRTVVAAAFEEHSLDLRSIPTKCRCDGPALPPASRFDPCSSLVAHLNGIPPKRRALTWQANMTCPVRPNVSALTVLTQSRARDAFILGRQEGTQTLTNGSSSTPSSSRLGVLHKPGPRA